MLELPAEAGATGIRHVMLGWNPAGHEPDGLYSVPHFDMHFYRIDQAERLAIVPDDPAFAAKAARLPTAAYVPAGYLPPPGRCCGCGPVAGTVPQMGMHWIDPLSPEFNGQPFTATFLHGSYDGRFTFEEPMITKAFHETRPDMYIRELPQPAKWAVAGSYPTRWMVTYDSIAKVYWVELGGLVRREAS